MSLCVCQKYRKIYGAQHSSSTSKAVSLQIFTICAIRANKAQNVDEFLAFQPHALTTCFRVPYACGNNLLEYSCLGPFNDFQNKTVLLRNKYCFTQIQTLNSCLHVKTVKVVNLTKSECDTF
jgi:hypothetical protein